MKTRFIWVFIPFILLISTINAQDKLTDKTADKFQNFKRGIYFLNSGWLGLMRSDGINEYLYDKAIASGADADERVGILPGQVMGLGFEFGVRGRGLEVGIPIEYSVSEKDNAIDESWPSSVDLFIKYSAMGISFRLHQSIRKYGKTTLYEGIEIKRKKANFYEKNEYTTRTMHFAGFVGFAFNNKAFNVRPHLGIMYMPLKYNRAPSQKKYDLSSVSLLIGVDFGFCIGT